MISLFQNVKQRIDIGRSTMVAGGDPIECQYDILISDNFKETQQLKLLYYQNKEFSYITTLNYSDLQDFIDPLEKRGFKLKSAPLEIKNVFPIGIDFQTGSVCTILSYDQAERLAIKLLKYVEQADL